jgi:predicted dehydrogenase
LDLQVHDVDFIHWILGHPRSVYTVGIQAPTGSWDHVHTTLTYPQAQASIEASLLMPSSWPFTTSTYVLGTKGALEYTFRGGANIQEREQTLHFFRLYKSDGAVSEPTASTDDRFATQLRYFAHCVAERQSPRRCPPEETCQVMQVMAASRQSAESGQVIPLGEERG